MNNRDERISVAEFESAISEIEVHRRYPTHDESECEFCDWVRTMAEKEKGFLMRFILSRPVTFDSIDLLLFLYAGIKLGRRQAFGELIGDIK